jgi:hypothetical protein
VIAPGEPGELSAAKTIVWIYPVGVHEFREVLPAILFSHAFSNGSVFWRIGSQVNFEMGSITRNPGVQETARILGLKSRVYISDETTAVWRSNDPRDSYVHKGFEGGVLSRWRQKWYHLIERREVMDLQSLYIRNYGVKDALEFSAKCDPAHKKRIERGLLLSGKYTVLTGRSVYWRVGLMMTGFACRFLVPSRIDLSRIPSGAG